MKTIHLTYCGMPGEGPTVAKAKQDAARKIEAAIYGSYTPTIRTYRGKSVLIYRSPEGWHTAHIHGDTERQTVSYCSPDGDYSEAIARAVMMLAQITWQRSDGLTHPVIEEIGAQTTEGRRLRSEFASWAKFQLMYAEAIRRGLNDCDAHNLAIGGFGRPDLAPMFREIETAVAGGDA